MVLAAADSCAQQAQPTPAPAAPAAPAAASSPYEAYGMDANRRFIETRDITVEVYNRMNDGGSDPANNHYTQWVQEKLLADHNINLTYMPVGRWTEVEDINNLLAAGDAPDVVVTYDLATINNYASQDAVINLAEYFEDANAPELFPNLYEFLGEDVIFFQQQPTGELWNLEGKRVEFARTSTFVREDWVAALGMELPTNVDEFEAMLVAFRDNADVLLGDDADQMIPMMLTYDVGWGASTLIDSFYPDEINDRNTYIYGFDDRGVLRGEPFKNAIKLLNKWYNMDLIWKDFPLYGRDDTTTASNLTKAGFVGASVDNWDNLYRGGEDSPQYRIQQAYGDEAAYIAVDTFLNEAGAYRKGSTYPGGTDRKVLFPYTNDEPMASLIFLDWLHDFDNLHYLQIGDEGVTHNVMDDGAIQTISATGEMIQNRPQNIDMTLLCNGLYFPDPEDVAKSLAYNYANVAPEYIVRSRSIAMNDARLSRPVVLGFVEAEEGFGAVLQDKRETFLPAAVVAAEADFDRIFDAGVQDVLDSFGQASIDERTEKWEAAYGDATVLDGYTYFYED
jgi:putative aldouronate transport system substrate-binding protein